jgi:hypothetical protein
MSDEIVDVETVDAENTSVETEADAPVEGEEALGDPGKRALDAMKAERKAALDRAKAAEAKAAELAAKLEGREAEYTAEIEKRKVKDEAILRAELKAAAKGKLADPSDASLFINLADFEVSETGDVDADALNTAIDDLISRKPHLAAGIQRRFEGDADAGKKGDRKGAQITSREELNRMTPEQVVEAEASGRLDTLLGRG